MNKGELIDSVQEKLGEEVQKKEAETALAAVLDSITEGVQNDGKVQLIGFGTFEVRERKARTGRNPKTGEPLEISASKSVAFKASAKFKGCL